MPPSTILLPALAHLSASAAQLRAAIAEAKCSIIAFEGAMGAGKTTLIRALCAALDVDDDVSSPTFALVNEYRDGSNQPVYHFDFYRINSEEEAERIGASEYFDSGYLCLVEWPARVAGLLPLPYLEVCLTVQPDEGRLIELKIIH